MAEGAPTGRGTLVRSKSLRLPTSRACAERHNEPREGTSRLRRHGSMRLVRAAGTSSSSSSGPDGAATGCSNMAPTMSASFHGQLSAEAPRKGAPPPSRRPPPARLEAPWDPSSSSSSGTRTPDESHGDWKPHFKRLIQEHERLQVKYHRLREHLLEKQCVELKALPGQRDLATIPEDEGDSPLGEVPPSVGGSPLLLGLHLEAQRLQHQLLQAQRAYWDLVVGSSGSNSQDPAALVVNLLKQLEQKQTELGAMRGRGDRLREALRQREQEVATCRDALHDYQLEMEEQRAAHQALKAKLSDLQGQLQEAREGSEFLQAECATLAEAHLEAEAEVQRLRADLEGSLRTGHALYLRSNKLFAKVQQKNLRLVELEADLEAQRQVGEECQTAPLAQLVAKLHSLLRNSALFAATQLQMDGEVLDEIMDDLEVLEEERPPSCDTSPQSCNTTHPPSLPLANGVPGFPRLNGDSNHSSPPSEADSPAGSLVCAVLRATHRRDGVAVNGEGTTANGDVSGANGDELDARMGGSGAGDGPGARWSGLGANGERSTTRMARSGANGEEGLGVRDDWVGTREDGMGSKGEGLGGKPVGTVPPFRTVAASVEANGHAGTPPCKGSQERLLAELVALPGKLARLHSLLQARVQERLRNNHEQIEELKKSLDAVCCEQQSCRQECALLGQQLHQSQARVASLEAKLDEAQETHLREVEVLLEQMEGLKEKQRCLLAVNQEQSRQLRDELGRLTDTPGFLVEADAICDKFQLKQQIESLKEEVVLKEEQLKGLAGKFSRFKKIYEDNYQRATEDIDKLDTMLEKVIETLEMEPEVVSSCGALSRLLDNLRGAPPPGQTTPKGPCQTPL